MEIKRQMPAAKVLRVRDHGRKFTLAECPYCGDQHWLIGGPGQVAECLHRPNLKMYVPEEIPTERK